MSIRSPADLAKGRLPRNARRSGNEARSPSPPPSEPFVRRATHTAQASTSAPRGTQRSVSLHLAVDLSMAVGVQQLQIIGLLTAASTAPGPRMDVPGLLLGLKKSPAHHASTPLSLPEILDPDSTCQGVGQLPGRPLLPFEFRLQIGDGTETFPNLRNGRAVCANFSSRSLPGFAGFVRIRPRLARPPDP